jgi:hypothetical protein
VYDFVWMCGFFVKGRNAWFGVFVRDFSQGRG